MLTRTRYKRSTSIMWHTLSRSCKCSAAVLPSFRWIYTYKFKYSHCLCVMLNMCWINLIEHDLIQCKGLPCTGILAVAPKSCWKCDLPKRFASQSCHGWQHLWQKLDWGIGFLALSVCPWQVENKNTKGYRPIHTFLVLLTRASTAALHMAMWPESGHWVMCSVDSSFYLQQRQILATVGSKWDSSLLTHTWYSCGKVSITWWTASKAILSKPYTSAIPQSMYKSHVTSFPHAYTWFFECCS